MLKAYCTKEDLSFDEVAYDAFVVNIIDQNLKDDTQRIKNFCGIKGSINAEVFKLGLSTYLSEGMPAFEELKKCIFDRL